MAVYARAWRDKEGRRHTAWVIKTVVNLPDGRKVRLRKHAQRNDKRFAKQEEQRLVAAVLDGSYGRRDGIPSVAEVAAEFLKASAGLVKPSSHAWYRDQLHRVIIPAMGEHLIDEVHGELLDDFRAEVSLGRAVETVRGTLRVVRRLLNFAEDRGHIPKAPTLKLPKDPNAVSSPRFLTFAESGALLKAAEGEPDWWAFIMVGLRTGLRVGELIALRWDEVDFRARKVRVKRSIYEGVETSPKSGRERDVPLSAQALAALKAHRKQHPNDEVVFGVGDGGRMTRHMVTPALHRFARAAGLEAVGPHVLRHSFGSHSAMLGVPLRILQDWMGHASVTQTEVYAKLAPGSGQSLVDLLDRPSRRAGRA